MTGCSKLRRGSLPAAQGGGWRVEAWSPADPQLHALIRVGALEGIFYIGAPQHIPQLEETGIPLAYYHYPGLPWYGDVNLVISK